MQDKTGQHEGESRGRHMRDETKGRQAAKARAPWMMIPQTNDTRMLSVLMTSFLLNIMHQTCRKDDTSTRIPVRKHKCDRNGHRGDYMDPWRCGLLWPFCGFGRINQSITYLTSNLGWATTPIIPQQSVVLFCSWRKLHWKMPAAAAAATRPATNKVRCESSCVDVTTAALEAVCRSCSVADTPIKGCFWTRREICREARNADWNMMLLLFLCRKKITQWEEPLGKQQSIQWIRFMYRWTEDPSDCESAESCLVHVMCVWLFHYRETTCMRSFYYCSYCTNSNHPCIVFTIASW